jgi:hypothetical protein
MATGRIRNLSNIFCVVANPEGVKRSPKQRGDCLARPPKERGQANAARNATLWFVSWILPEEAIKGYQNSEDAPDTSKVLGASLVGRKYQRLSKTKVKGR